MTDLYLKKQVKPIPVDYILYRLWNEVIIVSSNVPFKDVYVINNDCIVIKQH